MLHRLKVVVDIFEGAAQFGPLTFDAQSCWRRLSAFSVSVCGQRGGEVCNFRVWSQQGANTASINPKTAEGFEIKVQQFISRVMPRPK